MHNNVWSTYNPVRVPFFIKLSWITSFTPLKQSFVRCWLTKLWDKKPRVTAGNMLGVLPVSASFPLTKIRSIESSSSSKPCFSTAQVQHYHTHPGLSHHCLKTSGLKELVLTLNAIERHADNSKMLLSTCWFSIGVPILFVKDRNMVMTCLFILCVEILLREHDMT